MEFLQVNTGSSYGVLTTMRIDRFVICLEFTCDLLLVVHTVTETRWVAPNHRVGSPYTYARSGHIRDFPSTRVWAKTYIRPTIYRRRRQCAQLANMITNRVMGVDLAHRRYRALFTRIAPLGVIWRSKRLISVS